uniref:Uncharacterized protein n=1 Tax=Globodera rostochiensis TaxID=31243 RepID=A0A914HLM8_GLORO
MDKFYNVIKAKKVLCGAQQLKTDQKKGALMRQRRRKRDDGDTIIWISSSSGSSSRGLSGCAISVVCAIFSFVGGIAAYFHIIYLDSLGFESYISYFGTMQAVD